MSGLALQGRKSPGPFAFGTVAGMRMGSTGVEGGGHMPIGLMCSGDVLPRQFTMKEKNIWKLLHGHLDYQAVWPRSEGKNIGEQRSTLTLSP